MEYKGTRWFKCDFHLHTTASCCFQDKTITPDQWVDKAIEVGLDCVAVTDHNTGSKIDDVKKAAIGKNLTVFPGVEITCDTSKIHLLVIFDVDKSTQYVEDFLIACGIDRSVFGSQTASTQKSIFEIVEIALSKGGLVIPAHIDEYNGLESVSPSNMEVFFKDSNINAVHVVHKQFYKSEKIDSQLINDLNNYYDNPNPKLEEVTLKKWSKPVTLARQHKKAVLTFSDNPHEEKSPKHGLQGIGQRYSWIKMDENPSLESLRQAFLMPDFRVKNCFDNENIPYKQPELWIKSIKINNTLITDKDSPLDIEFSPQLNTIVGGRGSGKSSILRFIRGVLPINESLKHLIGTEVDHTDFFQKKDDKNKGVLTEETSIEIIFIRNGLQHKVTVSPAKLKEPAKIEQFNSSGGIWAVISDEGFIDFFKCEHYSQKQIYEMASEPDAIREVIDSSIPEVGELKKHKDIIKQSFLAKSAEIRSMSLQVSGKGKLQTEINDLAIKIADYVELNSDDVFLKRSTFITEEDHINKFKHDLEGKEVELTNLAENFKSPVYLGNDPDILKFSSDVDKKLLTIRATLNDLVKDIKDIKDGYLDEVTRSSWKEQFADNNAAFLAKKQALIDAGIDDINAFEQQSQSKNAKEKELEKIIAIEESLISCRLKKEELKQDYINTLKNITSKRKEFVQKTLAGENVKIEVKGFRNKMDFEKQLRKIFERDKEFQSDIEKLVMSCFQGSVEKKLEEIKAQIYNIKEGGSIGSIGANFRKFVTTLDDVQLDEIAILMPEDEIEVEYKLDNSNKYKSLSTASAGQKTTAILTFILSYGESPLILDQPEDDLDNRLVYDLIVKRLTTAKEKRQLIIVTHNANIPVNADAEYIISMDSESEKIRPLVTGSVDSSKIKDEICAVMEGGKGAFKMRSNRYNIKH